MRLKGHKGPYLTEEHKHAHMELQQPCDAERPPFCAAQGIKQQLSAQGALPLLGPHIYFLLAISKCTVLSILAFLALLHLCKGQDGKYKYIFNMFSLHKVPFLLTYICTSGYVEVLAKILNIGTFTEYKCPQEVVSCRPWADPLPSGIICVLEAAQKHIPLTAVRCLRLIFVVHYSWT